MASDAKKKKIDSLMKSISNLESQETLAKSQGNKRQLDSAKKIRERLESDLENIKRS